MGVELELGEQFIDVEEDPYGILLFRIRLKSGRIFPTHKLQETVLAKKSRHKLRNQHESMRQEMGIDYG